MKLRKIALTLCAVIALALAGGSQAMASQPDSPPGQGECDHGNSQQSCKPDPQPSNGQDCEEHGPKEGGVNEDHCLGGAPSSEPSSDPTPSSEPTPSVTPSTSPTESPLPSTSPPGPSDAPTSVPSIAPTPSTGPISLPPTDTTSAEATAGPSDGMHGPLDYILLALTLLLAGGYFYWTLGPRSGTRGRRTGR